MKRRSHQTRRAKARAIRAGAKIDFIRIEAAAVDWIEAAADDKPDSPRRFKMTAYTGGPMQVDHYGPPIAIALEGLKAKVPIPILLNHDQGQIVGHADETDIGSSTLKLSGIISGAGPAAQEVVESAGKGFPWKASVGARPDKLEFVGEGVKTQVNGKTLTGPLYVARKATLQEVSFLAVAADDRTSAKVAASAANPKENDMEFTQWIKALGLKPDDLREDQTVALRATYDAEIKAAAEKDTKPIEGAADKGSKPIEGAPKTDPPKIEPPKFDLKAVVLASKKHQASVQATAASYADELPDESLAPIKAKAVTAGWEFEKKALEEEWPAIRLEAELIKAHALYEVELIRAERPKGPGIHSSSRDGLITADVMTAAILASGQISKPEDHCTDKHLEAARKAFPRGIGLQELIVAGARANGWQGYSFKQDSRECMRYAFAPIQAGGFSTVAITNILSNVANKFLLEGFTFVEQAWREIASFRTVADFKTATSYRLTGESTYKLVPPSGEIEHGTLADESYTNKADTYALMLAITRTDIINDDLGAITSVPRRLGNGAGRTLNHIFWTVYLAAQGTLFTAARLNYWDGAGSALSIDSLTTGEQKFMDLKDTDGHPIGHMPVILLVPTALSATSAALFNSTEIRDTTASTKYPVNNPHKGKFRPVVSRYMGNSAYTGYSTTAWNLLADPRELSTVEVCFLNGQQSPTVEQADANFDTLGVQMRAYFDFGVNDQDYRGGVRSKGAA